MLFVFTLTNQTINDISVVDFKATQCCFKAERLLVGVQKNTLYQLIAVETDQYLLGSS